MNPVMLAAFEDELMKIAAVHYGLDKDAAIGQALKSLAGGAGTAWAKMTGGLTPAMMEAAKGAKFVPGAAPALGGATLRVGAAPGAAGAAKLRAMSQAAGRPVSGAGFGI